MPTISKNFITSLRMRNKSIVNILSGPFLYPKMPGNCKGFLFLAFVILSITPDCVAQEIPTVSWKILQNIQVEKLTIPGSAERSFSPVFGPEQLALNGKVVKLSGFIIPADEKGEYLYLSAGMYSSCFFCGRGSPASIVTVWLKKKNKEYTTDEFRTFKGKLRLNQDNPGEFFYILENSVEQ